MLAIELARGKYAACAVLVFYGVINGVCIMGNRMNGRQAKKMRFTVNEKKDYA